MYEYQLYFPDPIVGDTVEHTITVRAWDGEGNSAFVSYRILYRFVDTATSSARPISSSMPPPWDWM